ncbi:MAG: hypothetical protein ACJAY2_002329 [Pseudomonadales bacterium]|jgi:hypothetical protein
MTHDDGIQNSKFFETTLVLLQRSHAYTWQQVDCTGAWFQVAAQYFHERGLAATVGANQTVVITLVEFDGNVVE